MLIYLIGYWLISLLAACYVSTQKDRPITSGLFLDLTLGPLGALIEALLPSEQQASQPSGIADRIRPR